MAIREIMRSGALAITPGMKRFSHPGVYVTAIISSLKFIFIITCTFMTFGLTILSQPVQGATIIPDDRALISGGPLNYNEAVKIALEKSPSSASYFLRVGTVRSNVSRIGIFEKTNCLAAKGG
jgi:hypothetical protein